MKVTFYPDNINITADDNKKLIDIARENNIHIADELCGNGACGKCKVIIKEGADTPLTLKERKILSEEEIKAGVRLACSYKVESDTKVLLLLDGAVRSKGYRKKSVADDEEKKQLANSEVIERMQVTNSDVTAANPQIRNQRCREEDAKKYGIVADIGTTNVVCGLYELEGIMDSTTPIETLSAANPQKLMGMEVVGRIAFAKDERKLAQLQKLICGCINTLISRLLEDRSGEIKKVVICGNTTMIHMFLGKDVKGLGAFPFTTGYMGGEILPAKDYIKNVPEDAKLYVPSFIGGHVGSDALCCLYNNLSDENLSKKWAIIDIGTNAEIILNNSGRLLACGAAAGPAFEGMGIRYGSKCVSGSVIAATIEDGKWKYSVKDMGELYADDERMKEVKSICASGMIDILSGLKNEKEIDFFGTFKSFGPTNVHLHEDEEPTKKPNDVFYLSKGLSQLTISQADIRNIQLAKSAVLSGLLTMLEKENLSPDDLDNILLTGAFGNGIDLKNAMNIRLLPKTDKDKYIFLENGAIDGAAKVLIGDSKVQIAKLKNLAGNVEHIELGQEEKFEKIFIDNMNV